MKENEITNIKALLSCSWEVSSNCGISYSDVRNISSEEQECHLNVDKFSEKIYIDCSYRNYITKLSHNPNFILDSIVLNPHGSGMGQIMSIKGTLPLWGISLRHKRRCITGGEAKSE